MSDTVLILRTCNPDLSSPAPQANGFRWPESGPVECADWDPKPHSGHGLHGWLWGEGKGHLGPWDPEAKWLVAEVPAETIVDLGGKVKFPRANVVHCGDRLSATAYLAARAPGRVIIGGTATAGDRGTATAGHSGTATAGYSGTATAGYSGILAVKWWDPKTLRYRLAVGYPGEDGIESGKPYCVQDGKLVRAPEKKS